MSLNEEDIKAVVFYRKEKAYATLREAEDMIDGRKVVQTVIEKVR